MLQTLNRLLFPLLLAPVSVIGQTTHDVEVGGSLVGSTAPFYSPQHLTINNGDIVIWTNVSGTHNVNGSTTHYPDNPASFYSGPTGSGGWTFQYTFTIPGMYEYHCDSQGHAATQHGTVLVMDGNSVAENEDTETIVLFPVPADELLVIDIGKRRIRSAEIISIDGRSIIVPSTASGSRLEIPLHGLSSGQYHVRLVDEHEQVITRSFKKE